MADDYSNNISTAGVLTVGASLGANFEVANDSDRFKAALEGGTTCLFSLSVAAQDGTLSGLSQVTMNLASAGAPTRWR